MRGKALNVVVFDPEGRPLGQYRTADECSKVVNVHPSTIYRLIKNGEALSRKGVAGNGITFDTNEEGE